MSLKQKIADNLKSALKSGEDIKLSTLRMLSAAIANKEIELRKKDVGLSDEEILEVVSGEAKKRKDAALEYKKGGRGDLADKESKELVVLQMYLPPEISDSELLRIVENGILEAGASSEKDFGKVMKIIMPTLKGRASGERISSALQKKLAK